MRWTRGAPGRDRASSSASATTPCTAPGRRLAVRRKARAREGTHLFVGAERLGALGEAALSRVRVLRAPSRQRVRTGNARERGIDAPRCPALARPPPRSTRRRRSLASRSPLVPAGSTREAAGPPGPWCPARDGLLRHPRLVGSTARLPALRERTIRLALEVRRCDDRQDAAAGSARASGRGRARRSSCHGSGDRGRLPSRALESVARFGCCWAPFSASSGASGCCASAGTGAAPRGGGRGAAWAR